MNKARIVSLSVFVFIIIIFFTLNSFSVTYKYDELNRLVEVIYDSGTTVRYTYDAAGNILKTEVIKTYRLNPIGNKMISPGKLLTFTVSVSGAGDAVTVFAAYNLPEGAQFDTDTGIFSWTPGSNQTGVYKGIRFEASVGETVLSEEITITVMDENTSAGRNIQVVDENSGASITFENVKTPGITTVSVHNELPEGIALAVNMIPIYYNIETNAEFSGSVRIKLNYDTSLDKENENDLRLYQVKDEKTTDITEPVKPGPGGNPDTKEKTIEGVVDHFCYFGIGIPNRAPVAHAGLNQTDKANSDKCAEITLDGSLSYDPDASLTALSRPGMTPDGRSIVSYKWTGPFGEAEGISPKVIIPAGVWECTLTVSDGWLDSKDKVIIRVNELVTDESDEQDNDEIYEKDNAKDDTKYDSGKKEKEENKGVDDSGVNEYDNFEYVLFSGSSDTPISIYGANIVVEGDMHTNDNFLFHGFNFYLDGACKVVGEAVAIGNNVRIKNKELNAQTIKMPDWIPVIKEKAFENGKYLYTGKNYSADTFVLQTPVSVNGNLSFSCASLATSGHIFASGNISINAAAFKNTGEKRTVICSENGNVIIKGSEVTLNGLIYAPKGTVVIDASNFTMTGNIVANNILIRGNCVNIVNEKQ